MRPANCPDFKPGNLFCNQKTNRKFRVLMTKKKFPYLRKLLYSSPEKRAFPYQDTEKERNNSWPKEFC
jgi:hypothetical protein